MGVKGNMQRLTFWLALIALSIAYIAILNRYGTALPPPWPPDEIVQVMLAKSWATSELEQVSFLADDDSRTKNSKSTQREVYPLLVYTTPLSLWGKVFGFSLSSMRWFNRLLGALGLVLVFLLAQRWRAPTWLAFLTATWVGMDITYQLIGNFLRPEILCVVLMLTGLLVFTKGWESKQVFWFIVAGSIFALSMLTHPLLGTTTTFALLTYLCLQRQGRLFLSFLSPLLVLGLIILIYVGSPKVIAGQILSFVGYLAEDKSPKSLPELLSLLLGGGTLWSVCDLFPSNTPPWLALLAVTVMGQGKGHFRFYGWQMIFFVIAYLTAALGGHPWYFGWFAPLGYLLVTRILAQFLQAAIKPLNLVPLIVITMIWVGYQASKVLPCWRAAPTIRSAHEKFFTDLALQLPPKSKVLLYSVPDPSFHLLEKRPDAKIYVPTGAKTSRSQWEKLLDDLDGFVVLEVDWVFTKPIVILPERYRVVRRWKIPSVRLTYSVVWLNTSKQVSSGLAPNYGS